MARRWAAARIVEQGCLHLRRCSRRPLLCVAIGPWREIRRGVRSIEVGGARCAQPQGEGGDSKSLRWLPPPRPIPPVLTVQRDSDEAMHACATPCHAGADVAPPTR